jgi:hypothetical protein
MDAFTVIAIRAVATKSGDSAGWRRLLGSRWPTPGGGPFRCEEGNTKTVKVA